MDFIKRQTSTDIVKENYTDLQVQRSDEWIANYKGSNILQDWLEYVPFDVTPDNRQNYNDTFEKLSGLSRDDFNSSRITEITARLDEASAPLDKLYVLQGVNDRENDDVVNYFMPKLTQLQEYISTDFAHKSTISHEKALEQNLSKIFTPDAALDALVPESAHIRDIQAIERLNKLDVAKIVNGRVTAPDAEGKPIIGSNLTIDENSPDAAEQYAIQVNSFKPIQRILRPHLEMAKSITTEGKRQVDETLYNSIDTLSLVDVAPVIANMLDYPEVDTKDVIKKGIDTFTNSTPAADKPRAIAKVTGQLISTLYKRSTI